MPAGEQREILDLLTLLSRGLPPTARDAIMKKPDAASGDHASPTFFHKCRGFVLF